MQAVPAVLVGDANRYQPVMVILWVRGIGNPWQTIAFRDLPGAY
jgi:hypothetical protein